MQRRSYSKRILPNQHQKIKSKISDGIHKVSKNYSKCSDAQKQIPKIINELQKNIKLLKNIYVQEENKSINSYNTNANIKKKVKPKSLLRTKSHSKMPEAQDTTSAQLQDIRKSFLTANGYQSNNLVELYNFYKKSILSSTRIMGSMSMQNAGSSLNNFSEFRQKKEKEQSLTLNQMEEQKVQKKIPVKSSVCLSDFVKNGCELVNVASLLAEKRKVKSKEKNQQKSTPNFQQCKRKLVRPNTNQNIQRFNQVKENLRIQNKQVQGQKSRCGINGEMKCYNDPKGAMKQLLPLETKIQKTDRKSPRNISSLIQYDKKQEKIFSPEIRKLSSSKKKNSSRKKSSSKKSMNQGIIFGFGSSQKSKTQKSDVQIKPFRNVAEESFLGSEITAKTHSRVLDLEDIPFQF